ncbi:hypothetical protein MtrunA17_Chr3g0081501 [Medicago truncatula]|uniref:Uncharacterized protein n=1 Tax=Medicago truncatula TaxID=3880 RepID=A0A396ILF8_MEDTR|nr:hypothetical protein MtrunA17_Chr3g0081501 [Medicago truncatula]
MFECDVPFMMFTLIIVLKFLSWENGVLHYVLGRTLVLGQGGHVLNTLREERLST